MMEGFYRIAYTGAAGSGFGILVFNSGKIAGADVAGGIYNGTYTEDGPTNQINYQVMMQIPAGVAPVQSGIPLAAPIAFPIQGVLQPSDVESGQPRLLQTPIGPVNVVFSKIRDFS